MKLLFSKLVDQEESFVRVDAARSQFIAVVVMIIWNTARISTLDFVFYKNCWMAFLFAVDYWILSYG